MDKLIHTFEANALWQVSEKGLNDFSEFVVRTNYSKHLDSQPSRMEILQALRLDKYLYSHSMFYAIKNSDKKYIGTIRVTKWKEGISLPFNETFGINIPKVLGQRKLSPKEVWYVGRLCIEENSSLSLAENSRILKMLLVQAFAPICKDDNNILLAECDERFLSATPHLGLKNTEFLSGPKKCIGSNTIPVMNTSRNLTPFFEKNKHLCYV